MTASTTDPTTGPTAASTADATPGAPAGGGVRPGKDLRIAALRRFGTAITALTILGHALLGFEQGYAHPLVALGIAYSVEILLELIDAAASGRRVAFRGGGAVRLIDFLLPAHITGLACAMLLYPNERLWPVAFAAAVGVASKAILRARIGGAVRHFMNPSNTGIAATLLAFPSVGVAMPYQFTENLAGAADWVLPAAIVCVGTFLNGKLTRRLPLIAGWLGGFALQALARSALFGVHLAAALAPMTGMAFVLFTFYMVPDPGTTPSRPWRQVCFGAVVAATYGALQVLHVVYGLFFALAAVCAVRGVGLWILEGAAMVRRQRARATAAPPIVESEVERAA
jgi:Na+-translocating ferredoxin:NAD+ oxidoreductase RnfD subunit